MTDILTTLHGQIFGLSKDNQLVLRDPATSLNNIVAHPNLIKGYEFTTITSAQLLALNATPKAIITAPGTGFVVIPTLIGIYKPAGTAYAGIAAGEDLAISYTNGSGVKCACTVETTGFLDQTTAQTRWTRPTATTSTTVGDINAAANAAVVLSLITAEITTGDSPLYVKAWFDVVPSTFTA